MTRNHDSATLDDADFANQDLTGASFVSASIERASFVSSVLARANLTDARLRGADLRFADLTLAKLAGADLRSARLEGAKGVLWDSNRVDVDTDLGANPSDWWSRLKDKYSGPRVTHRLLLAATALALIWTKAVLWRAIGEWQQNIATPVLEAAGLERGTVAHVVLEGGGLGWFGYIVSPLLVVYYLALLWLGREVGALRAREIQVGLTPRAQEIRLLWGLHFFGASWLLWLAMIAAGITMWATLTTPVWL